MTNITTVPKHSHRKKRMQQIRKQMQRGLLDPEKEDPFSLFVASTSIRYCYYSETQNILGNTYGMCVLQVRAGMGRSGGTVTEEQREGEGEVIDQDLPDWLRLSCTARLSPPPSTCPPGL